MGVVYGAGSLWQWKLWTGEPGHADWCSAKTAGWREAMGFEGARYVGVVSKILGGWTGFGRTDGLCMGVGGWR